MPNPTYNELKYLVSATSLPHVVAILEQFLGNSDPFTCGTVDSVYFDTNDDRFFGQCADGSANKVKFRLRGYGDGRFTSAQIKSKDLFGVRKVKSAIDITTPPHRMDWLQIIMSSGSSDILAYSMQFGPLLPLLQVRYQRRRYRSFDYRITLDSQIETRLLSNHHHTSRGYNLLPHHVLEVKTYHERPFLPFLNLLSLKQISCSKYYLGLLHAAEEATEASPIPS